MGTEAPMLPAVVSRPETLGMVAVVDLATAVAHRQELQQFVKGVMFDGEHYGLIPGTPKPSLFKPGAEALCEIYGLYPEYEMVQRIEDWGKIPELFDYEIKCVLRSKRDQSKVSEGMGSCNSYESKYKYRDAKRICPNEDCGKPALMPSKKEWGGGFYCNPKGGGCGSSWKEFQTERHTPNAKEIDMVKAIREQQNGKVDNEDMPSQKNTILKMAKKRAFIDATLGATRSSGIFTQDVEDFKVEAVDADSVKEVQVEEKKAREEEKKASRKKTVAAPATAESSSALVDVAEVKEADPKSASTPEANESPTQGTSEASSSAATAEGDGQTPPPGKAEVLQILELAKAEGKRTEAEAKAAVNAFLKGIGATPNTLTWNQFKLAVQHFQRPLKEQ